MSDPNQWPVLGQPNPWGPPGPQPGPLQPQQDQPQQDQRQQGYGPARGSSAEQSGRCMVVVGFYVLTRCGAPARLFCPSCGRGACGAHVVAGDRGTVCQTCDAEQYAYEPDARDPNWASRYGRRYRGQAAQRFGDPGMAWSFDRHDRHYTSSSMSSHDSYDHDVHDHDIFDS